MHQIYAGKSSRRAWRRHPIANRLVIIRADLAQVEPFIGSQDWACRGYPLFWKAARHDADACDNRWIKSGDGDGAQKVIRLTDALQLQSEPEATRNQRSAEGAADTTFMSLL
jgi:hypothetical protein